MKFGSDEMIDLMRRHLEDADDITWYNELFESVYKHTEKRLRRWAWQLVSTDREDLVQIVVEQVYKTVIIKKVDFYIRNENRSVAERVAWLNRVIDSKVTDLIRSKAGGIQSVSLDLIYNDAASENDTKNVSGKERKQYVEKFAYDNRNNPESRSINRIRLTEAIKDIFSMNSSAEEKLVVLGNMMSVKNDGINGEPKKVVELYTGKTVGEICEDVKAQLADILGGRLPNEVIRIMDECTEPEKNNTFSMNESRITNKTYTMRKKINEIYAKKGELDDTRTH